MHWIWMQCCKRKWWLVKIMRIHFMPNNCSYLISSNKWFISIEIIMSIQKGGNNYKLWLSIGEDSLGLPLSSETWSKHNTCIECLKWQTEYCVFNIKQSLAQRGMWYWNSSFNFLTEARMGFLSSKFEVLHCSLNIGILCGIFCRLFVFVWRSQRNQVTSQIYCSL